MKWSKLFSIFAARIVTQTCSDWSFPSLKKMLVHKRSFDCNRNSRFGNITVGCVVFIHFFWGGQWVGNLKHWSHTDNTEESTKSHFLLFAPHAVSRILCSLFQTSNKNKHTIHTSGIQAKLVTKIWLRIGSHDACQCHAGESAMIIKHRHRNGAKWSYLAEISLSEQTTNIYFRYLQLPVDRTDCYAAISLVSRPTIWTISLLFGFVYIWWPSIYSYRSILHNPYMM